MSVLPKTEAEALRLIDKAEDAKADLIEVRLDGLKSHGGIADMAKQGETPKIATLKPISSHGGFSGTETEQKQILLTAAKAGFSYVDIDLSASNLHEFTTQISELGAKSIVSFHDFTRSLQLAELNQVLEREIADGADICKVVTTAKRIEDNLAMLNFTAAASKRVKIVCFAMGELGKVFRLLSPLFGGFFTFAALESGSETAPGQMSIEELRSAYELLGLK